MQNFEYISFIVLFLPQIPHLILWTTGIVFSLLFRRANPKKFLLTTISFSIFFLLSLANPFFYSWLGIQFNNDNLSTATQLGYSNFIFGAISQIVWFIAWIILFVAIFSKQYNQIENKQIDT